MSKNETTPRYELTLKVVHTSPEACRHGAIRMLGTSDTRKELLKEYKKMMKSEK